MDDLIELNRRIAAHWLGRLNANAEQYLLHICVCLGQFLPTSGDLAQALSPAKQTHYNSLPVAKLNRQYLRFARLGSKDVAAGRLEMLIILGITLEQASALARLTNSDITRLAFGWNGLIIDFAYESFKRGAALQTEAATHHATALCATDLATQVGS